MFETDFNQMLYDKFVLCYQGDIEVFKTPFTYSKTSA